MRPNLAAQLDPIYLESLYHQWLEDPLSVDESWGIFFLGFDLASCPRDCVAAAQAADQSAVASLIYNYRDQGHRMARINPLVDPPDALKDLELKTFGLSEKDLDRVFDTGHLHMPERATLGQIVEVLKATYCGSIGVEYLHIQDVSIRRWLQARMEPNRNRPNLSKQSKRDILEHLINADLFETFIHTHYLGQKRFSLEGSETLVPMLHRIVELGPELGIDEIVLGLTHRGRLNVLANLLDKSYATIFSEFEDNFIQNSTFGDGDVKYHKGFSSIHRNPDGKSLRLSVTANPSHLEAVGPVVLGRVRAKQRQLLDDDTRTRVMPLVVHGDAAFAGQGIVAETLNLSRLDGYGVGGCVHVVINNQIGFTTPPEQARSSSYVSDVAKMVEAPVFHVNGDDPEAAVQVAELALRYRQAFGRDVVVDLISFRRHGHSEVDDPAYTQPILYKKIGSHPKVKELYTRRLIESGDLTEAEERKWETDFQTRLDQAYRQAKQDTGEPEENLPDIHWTPIASAYQDTPVETGIPVDLLGEVAVAAARVPDGFHLNPKISRLLAARAEAIETRSAIDWATAECLAFGTLLCQGFGVRLSGQDSERGTFSQRHAVVRDAETAEAYVPLNHIRLNQARFDVTNSPLSEASVLGYEYGYSLAEPKTLVLWEAQFGDFANGAQVIIDQFIVAARSKWQRDSGLVLLLPHGYEGQGPEHSNAYLERYLSACAEQNMRVCNLTAPAQYFHVLRRQVLQAFRRPMVIMTPKSLLRNSLAVSRVDELSEAGFQEIIADPALSLDCRRVVFCSGKIYYELLQSRRDSDPLRAALVRLEQLYPFPETQLQAILEAAPLDAELCWVQEEPKNRGAWSYVAEKFCGLDEKRRLHYVGRKASASAAVGSLRLHRMEQEALIDAALRSNDLVTTKGGVPR